ncbi:hypothetical protein [Dactylosporangium sp. NPDC051484]|uniref:DUF6907 domain-containing protein n=1 Tax=Dactylosporangium sp. NPDC051484 TaxID=3154942 RepID=UPI00344D7F5D
MSTATLTTVTVERPATPAGPPAQVLKFVPCPDRLPWCLSHEADPDGAQYHHGAYVPIATGGPDVLVGRQQASEFDVTYARLDTADGNMLPVVWLLPGDFASLLGDAVGFTPDNARTLASALIAAADAVEVTNVAE